MGMAGYTKLFNSILASTIWRADDKTRLVWITLLAMADKDGVCEGSIPGLADMARVSIEDCEAALEILQSPDVYSRSSEHEGRRVEALDGVGWKLLNHAKYRAKMSEDERREYNRVKQAEYRERKKALLDVNDSQSQSAECTHTEAEAHTEAEEEREEAVSPPTLNKPALVLFEEMFGTAGAKFGEQIQLRVTDLGLWQKLLSDKSAFADDPLKRKGVSKWILKAYDEAVAEKQDERKQPDRLPTVEEKLAERKAGLTNLQPPPANFVSGVRRPRQAGGITSEGTGQA